MVPLVSASVVPLLMLLLCGLALAKRRDAYALLTRGAAEGLKTVLAVAPTLIVLMTVIAMLRASGALQLLEALLGPLLEPLGIPRELAPLLLIRPLSGSAALAVGAELITTHGPDSAVGRTAAVVLGSTETTFYAIGVYFGAAGVEKSRYAVPAALAADLAGFLMGALSIRLFF